MNPCNPRRSFLGANSTVRPSSWGGISKERGELGSPGRRDRLRKVRYQTISWSEKGGHRRRNRCAHGVRSIKPKNVLSSPKYSSNIKAAFQLSNF